MKTALVHDWLTCSGGAERVLEAIYSLYPAPIHTLVADKRAAPAFFADKEVRESFLQKLPFAARLFRWALPLFPLAIEQFDLSRYDLILSSSYAVSKGVRTNCNQLHICYCHTPMRYAWDLMDAYTKDLFPLKKMVSRWALKRLRKWDVASAPRVDHFIANSQFVAERIKRIYGRESTVIYPPVSTHLFELASKREEFYITCSRLVPYKKVDLLIEAFAHLPTKKLIVIGDGPEFGRLKKKASSNVELLGYQPLSFIQQILPRAKAFLFAAEEDFGIAPVEAQAAGVPVIAFARGGALETVEEGETGLFFGEQTPASLIAAIRDFEKKEGQFDRVRIKAKAERFSLARFNREFKEFVSQKMKEKSYRPLR
jgi:glycosyltransferase involved in cell wall biosynthesis